MAVLLEPTPQALQDTDLDEALKAMRKARPDYDKAENYYCAEVPEMFASARMRRAMRRSGINYQLNLARIVVESVVDRLEISSIASDDDSGSNSIIQRVMEANKFQLQGTNTMRKAEEFGDAYVIVWPRDGAVEQPGGSWAPEDIAIWYQDPRTMRVFYSDDNPLEIKFAAKKWEENSRTRIDLYYPPETAAEATEDGGELETRGRIESYQSVKGKKGKSAADFEPCTGSNADDSDADEDDDNPRHITYHDFGMPVFHFKTTPDQYGEPEHKPFYAVTDIIHKLAGSHMAGVDYQSFPQRYAILKDDADTSEAERTDAGMFSYPNQESGSTENYGGEARSQFKADPGSLWMDPEVKQFGQFDASDPKNFTDPMGFYIRVGATVSNTPLHYFDPSGDTPSGESLKTAEAPFIKKVENRKLSFGDTWRQVFTLVLRLAGFPDAKIEVNWKPSASNDDQYTWDRVQQKQASGVPVEQTLLEAGYTAKQLEDWETQGKDALPQKIDALVQLSVAVANFSTGVTTGVISAEQVGQIIDQMIGDATDVNTTTDAEPVAVPVAAAEPTDRGTGAGTAA